MSQAHAPASLMVFLFTDLVGSTSLYSGLGDRRADELRQDHDRLLRHCVAAHGGVAVKNTGDGVMAVFMSAVEAVACAVAIPDLNQVLKRMRWRLLPFGVLHFLRRRSIVRRVRALLLGVLPEVRRIGLYPLLIAEIHARAVAAGYLRGELSWTLEVNHAINAGIEATGARRHKIYRLYDKRIG